MVWDEVKQCFVLSDAVCLVTGGSAGVGAALVSSLLTENAQVRLLISIFGTKKMIYFKAILFWDQDDIF